MSQSMHPALFTRQSMLWLGLFLLVLLWSGIAPKSRFTWLLEVAPTLVGLLVLIATRQRFPLTPLLYALILIHCVILMVGGHYIYAEVPLFDRTAQWMGEFSEVLLGTLGYLWDTQSDMFYALCGALVALLVMVRWHDRQISERQMHERPIHKRIAI